MLRSISLTFALRSFSRRSSAFTRHVSKTSSKGSANAVKERGVSASEKVRVPRADRTWTKNEKAKFDEAHKFKTPWNLVSAVIVQRMPVILPDPHPIEADWDSFIDKLDEWRTKTIPEEWFSQLHGNDESTPSVAAEDTSTTTATQEEEGAFNWSDFEQEDQDRIDFTPAPRVTEADRTNDRKSLDRALSRKLYLIVRKHKAGWQASRHGQHPYEWHFPEVYWTNGESMRQAAERSLAAYVVSHDKLDKFWVSHAPSAHFRFPYPTDHQTATATYGAKVFFYHLLYNSGDLQFAPDVADHVWVTRDELKEYLQPDYFRLISPALPQDWDLLVPPDWTPQPRAQSHPPQ